MLDIRRGLLGKHDRHIILPQRAYRFSIAEPRFKKRFEDDIVRSEASVETLRALPIERRRVRVHPLEDHREARFRSTPSIVAEPCTIGDHAITSFTGDQWVYQSDLFTIHANPCPTTRARDRKAEDGGPTRREGRGLWARDRSGRVAGRIRTLRQYGDR